MNTQIPSMDWRQGYSTEADYTFGFYGMLNPDSLMLASLIQGVRPPADVVARGNGARSLTYCELGCGQGLTLNVLAARDPGGQYYGVDYNPSQIRNARALAQAAHLDNVHFIEESFNSLDTGSLPDFDVIVLHGIYSWVAADVRAGIVEIIRRKLKPGGLCYVSYNCAVGRSSDLPMRQLLLAMRDHGKGDVLERAKTAVTDLQSIAKMDAQYFAFNPTTARHVSNLHQHASAYIVHEYFNDAWQSFFFKDVARDMDGAKVSFIGNADHKFNRTELCLTERGRKVHDSLASVADRELIKDIWVNQRFRQDIYAKGPDQISPDRQADVLSTLTFRLTRPRSECALKVQLPSGSAQLPADPFEILLDRLAHGPVSGATLRSVFDGRPGAERRFVRAIQALQAVQMLELALDPSQKDLVRPRMKQLAQAIGSFVDNAKEVFVLPTLSNGLARSVGALEYFLFQAHKRDPARRSEIAADLLTKSGRTVAGKGTREAAVAIFAKNEADFCNKSLGLLLSLEAC